MPKAVTTPTKRVRREAPADDVAPETAEREDDRGQVRDEETRLSSPQEFYAALTERPDVRVFLERLANR